MELEEKEKAEKKKRGPKPSSVRLKKAFLWTSSLEERVLFELSRTSNIHSYLRTTTTNPHLLGQC